MAQLEDEVAGQQRQLDSMRKALANVVDVATHRKVKEQVVAKLAEKADVNLLAEKADLIEAHRAQFSEALANKADTLAVELCQSELARFMQDGFSALERQQAELAKALTEDVRSCQEQSGSQAALEALDSHQKVLAASLVDKAEVQALAEQESRLAKTESLVRQLEKATADAAEQLSATLTVEMSHEMLSKANAAAVEIQRKELELTRADLSRLEERVASIQEQELNDQALAKMDEWYKEKDHEQYLLAVARKERQDQQLVQALAKKADVSWFEQQKAIIDATQLSLTALNGSHQQLQVQLMDKVGPQMLEKQQARFEQEFSQARCELTDVSQKFDRHQEHLDMARAQLLEVIRQQHTLEVSLRMKADKAIVVCDEDQLESLYAKVGALEQRQEAGQREVCHLHDQLTTVARRASAIPAQSPHTLANLTGAGLSFVAGMKTIVPPASPREQHLVKHSPHGRKSPYLNKRKA